MSSEGRITSVRTEIKFGSATVFGVIDGDEHRLFDYYIDELVIFDNELVGKTFEEACLFKRQKDIAYLRS